MIKSKEEQDEDDNPYGIRGSGGIRSLHCCHVNHLFPCWIQRTHVILPLKESTFLAEGVPLAVHVLQ
jgi:hypothetical protein